MKRFSAALFVCLLFLSFASISSATNGDNLMGVGPISRSMGGVGIAAPQDAISAVFANPAAMCFGPYCPGTEINFGGTLFMPKVNTSIHLAGYNYPEKSFLPMGDTTINASSDKKVYAIPAIGLSVPINNDMRFGLAAYGVSGLGVDYRNSDIDDPYAYFDGNAPLAAGEYTQLQIMKFSPSISYRVSNNLSIGLGVHIDYANLDLRQGSSFNYGIGAQLGAIYKVSDTISVGASYVTPQEVNYKKVYDFNQDGKADSLKLAQPQQLGVGVSLQPMKDLLVEVDGKWLNWGDAKGYKDFDWKDQWVLALGAQYKPTKELALRAGYNYANNPVKVHNGWDGSFGFGDGGPYPNDAATVQGYQLARYYYETFRIIGFPAIAKQHVTVGLGYEISKSFALNAGYTHAFKESITENGTSPDGRDVTIKSTLSEDSLEFGFTWRF